MELDQKTTNNSVPQGTLLNELGISLKEKADTLSLSIEKIAEASGVSRVTIGNLFGGKLKNTSMDTLERVANAMGCFIRIDVKKISD